MSKNHLAVILCGIIFLLSAAVSSAGDSAVEGKDHIDAKSFHLVAKQLSVIFGIRAVFWNRPVADFVAPGSRRVPHPPAPPRTEPSVFRAAEQQGRLG
jgi:hypothetical protein